MLVCHHSGGQSERWSAILWTRLAWSRGPRDFTIFDARPAPSRTCGVPPAPGHHRTGRGGPVLSRDFLPVGRAGQLSTQVPILRRFPRPPPVLPLACLLPGSVEIDRGFSPPRNPGIRHARPVAFLGRGPLATPPRSAWGAVTYPTQEVAYPFHSECLRGRAKRIKTAGL